MAVLSQESALPMINCAGTTVLLVEQKVNMALATARRADVLEAGRVILSGTAQEVAADSSVQAAYLGGEA